MIFCLIQFYYISSSSWLALYISQSVRREKKILLYLSLSRLNAKLMKIKGLLFISCQWAVTPSQCMCLINAISVYMYQEKVMPKAFGNFSM